MKSFVIALVVIAVFGVELVAQSKDSVIEDLQWVAHVSHTKAVFIFPATKREQWSWYNVETPNDFLEYNWSVATGNHKLGYQFGPALFKIAPAKPASGSLSDLLDACQHTLWVVSEDGGHTAGDYGEAKIVDGKVHVIVTGNQLLAKIFGAKPTTVTMTIQTPEFTFRRKVVVAGCEI